MEECQLRDDWSRQCSPVLKADIIQALSTTFCFMVALNTCLSLLYALCLCRIRRPASRVCGFLLTVSGFLLSAPLASARIGDPEILPSEEAGLAAFFIFGDILDHVGLIMIIYWDICREAVLLIFSLDPIRKSASLSLCFRVGTGFMLSQLVILGSFLPCMTLSEDIGLRRVAISIFYVVQVSIIFGFAPPLAFGLLARSLHKLWAELPQGLPRKLKHRLRYTQWGLHLLMLICLVYAFCGLSPALVPELQTLGGFIYIYVIMLAAGFVVALLLCGELILTVKQLRSKALRTQPLDPEHVGKCLVAGANVLQHHNASHFRLTPVWHRGLEHSVMQAFERLAEQASEVRGQNGQSIESPLKPESTLKTTELCQQHVKPVTLSAQCSAWEVLAAGHAFRPLL